MKRLAPPVLVLAFVAAACAVQKVENKGGASPAAPAEASPSGGAPASGTSAYPSTPSMQPGVAPTVAPQATEAPAISPADDQRRREGALRAARSEVDRARGEVEASLSDCATACRALASLERATGHLCDLATAIEDRRKCEDAKTSVQSARTRIRASCGSCPGGPSLDKTAPIPSKP